MTPVVPSLTLRSGAKMPALGLGTWKIAAGDTTAAVLSALRCGYRLLDCAPVYGNQPQVGAAIQQALDEGTLRSRDELFVTSKLMTQTLDPTDFEAAVRTSLAELGVDYLDLALLQWPVAGGDLIIQNVWARIPCAAEDGCAAIALWLDDVIACHGRRDLEPLAALAVAVEDVCLREDS